MTSPLVSVSDLATFLGDNQINTARATMILDQAQQACADAAGGTVPATKAYVVMRVAVRAYMSGGGQSRQYQLRMAGGDYPDSNDSGGVYLTAADRADLLDQEESPAATEAFTMHLHRPGYGNVGLIGTVYDTPIVPEPYPWTGRPGYGGYWG